MAQQSHSTAHCTNGILMNELPSPISCLPCSGAEHKRPIYHEWDLRGEKQDPKSGSFDGRCKESCFVPSFVAWGWSPGCVRQGKGAGDELCASPCPRRVWGVGTWPSGQESERRWREMQPQMLRDREVGPRLNQASRAQGRDGGTGGGGGGGWTQQGPRATPAGGAGETGRALNAPSACFRLLTSHPRGF